METGKHHTDACWDRQMSRSSVDKAANVIRF
jgi:hypothetical protein